MTMPSDSHTTGRDPRHDVLFEPVQIGPVTARNRFYQVPHCTGFGVEKPWTQAAFRGTKAEGGWAVVSTEYCSISAESDESPYVSARLWDDEDAAALRLMTDEAHRHGALAAVELWHGGSHAEQRESRLPPLAPSQIANEHVGVLVPKAMTIADIERTQEDWVRAAVRARDAGFDIVYVYGAHTYLPTQFLSPRTNHRTDRYGGSFANRARFWLETIERVKAAIGDRCAIAVRIAADTLEGAGVEPDEGIAFVRLADPHVDLWDVTAGGLAGIERVDSGPSRFFPEGHQRQLTGWIRAATKKPVVGTGRYTDPDRMAADVASGVIDMIGAARPSIADPFLPRKIEEGRYGDVRECIGCNACYSRSIWGRHLGCTQNATAGEEHRRGWHPERFTPVADTDRDVLVVGAGPAGLECAIVLARRGFRRVHLVTADGDVGGSLRWIPKLPGLGEWGRLVDWRKGQLAALRRQVEVHTRSALTAEDVLAYGAQIVVLATGSRWAADGTNGLTSGPLPGVEHVRSLTPEQLMVNGAMIEPGEAVTVLDCEGYFVGPGIAERLALGGCQTTLMTPYSPVAPWCDQTLEGPRLRARLAAVGVVVAEGRMPADAREVVADVVVLATQRLSNDALGLELAGRATAWAAAGLDLVVSAGDCVAPRLIADAIFDGHRVGREIDAGDPSRALPYRRERPLVG